MTEDRGQWSGFRGSMHSYLCSSLLVLAICACLGCGCSFGPVNTPAFSADYSVRFIDPNNGPFVIEQSEEPDPNTGQMRKSLGIKWKPIGIHPNLKDSRTFSVSYDSLRFYLSGHVVVPVTMPGGRTYSAILDTGCGCPFHVYVNDDVVRDCNLAVFPGGKSPETGCLAGLCEIPSMKLAQVTVTNPLCVYVHRQWQFRVFGVPFYRNRTVLIGTGLMRAFSYILFDNVKQKVVFGLNDAFKPDDSSQWVNHPFVLEKVRDLRYLMTDISLADSTIHVLFDTGGGKPPDLILREAVWRRLKGNLEARGGSAATHLSYQYGWLPCRRYVLPELRIGQMILDNAVVDILPDDSPLVQDYEGIISLYYFKKTTVVLDFKQNLLWFKRF